MYVDIETNLTASYADKRVWSIAILHNGVYRHFFARTFQQEGTILAAFIDYVKTQDTKTLVCFAWGAFDKGVLTGALTRQRLDVKFFLSLNLLDLCYNIKKHFVLPLKSYSVKDVGRYFGYKFANDKFDGLYVAMQYIMTTRLKQKLPTEIFRYIEDDVRVMQHIVLELQKRPLEDIHSYSVLEKTLTKMRTFSV